MTELANLAVEGFSSLRFGCTLALAMLGLAPVLVSGKRAAAAAGLFWAAAALSGWARFADLWWAPPSGALLAAAGTGLAVVVLLAAWKPSWSSISFAAIYSGLIAGWLWVPCVGEHLSEPLNNAAGDPAGNLSPIASYVLGVSAPLFAIAALPWLWAKLADVRDSGGAAMSAGVLGTVLALTVATGWYNEFVVHFSGY